MKCVKCGKEIPNESKYCRYCGASVKVQDELENTSGRRCKKCGALVKDGFAFCDQCGAPVEENNIDLNLKKNERLEKKEISTGVIVAAIFFAAFLVGIGIYTFMGKNRIDDIEEAKNVETAVEDKEQKMVEQQEELEILSETTKQQEETEVASKTTDQYEETNTSSEEAMQNNTTGAYFNDTENKNENGSDSDDLTMESEIDTITAETSVGDIVCYGSYEQNNHFDDGKEEVEWLVLDELEDRYLLITSEIIDCECYNNVWKDTAWENSTLRDWLNTSFLKETFTENQIDRIVYSEHTDEEGNISSDQVFILNTKELEEYFDSNDERAAGATSYAEAQGVYVYSNRNCWWWVSDAGADPHYAKYVNCEGVILEYGMLVFNNAFGVRPAIWVNK